MISNCSHDENGRYRDGNAGDQNSEWVVRSWYNRPWTVILRHPDESVANELAYLARAAAENDHIGYDQNQRYTFWERLKETGDYDPAKITKNCEADCSSGVAAIVKAAGYRLGIDKLTTMSIYAYTGDLRSRCLRIGFLELRDSKYLDSDDYLLPGDILLYEGHHTCINLDEGRYANNKPTIYKGYKDSEKGGAWCKTMQIGLNAVIRANLDEDGSCGSLTDAAIREFQRQQIAAGYPKCGTNGKPDGRFGSNSWARLEELLMKKTHFVEAVSAGSYEYDEFKDGYYHIVELDIWTR